MRTTALSIPEAYAVGQSTALWQVANIVRPMVFSAARVILANHESPLRPSTLFVTQKII